MFKRKAYQELVNWKKESNGKSAILLEGARRVGKSTIAINFGKNEYKSYILIDFSNVNNEILSLFDDIDNLDLFFLKLQVITNKTLYLRDSLIIFDEVQLFPKARQAIKHLVKDGRYDYLETGSLISINKNVDKILIPSEERKIEIYPLDYEEFCNAINYNYSNLKKLYDFHNSIGESTNRTLMKIFRLYVAIGGMPQAIEAYLNKRNFNEINQIKQDIINLYKEDLKKIDKSGRLSTMYESIPAQLVSNKNKFSFGYGLGKKTLKDNERLFDLLDSKIVNICYNLKDISPSLSMYTDFSKFKLYVGDTGLFVTMLFNSDNKDHQDIYNKLLSDKLNLNLGYLYENVISQLIISSNRKLYYYLYDKENSTHKYEIDFILSNKNKIIPLEVKSNKVNNHKSIDDFSIKYSKLISSKYLISSKDYFKEKDLINIPYYLFPFLLDDLNSNY